MWAVTRIITDGYKKEGVSKVNQKNTNKLRALVNKVMNLLFL
jgi:hypothetical protein